MVLARIYRSGKLKEIEKEKLYILLLLPFKTRHNGCQKIFTWISTIAKQGFSNAKSYMQKATLYICNYKRHSEQKINSNEL